MAQAALVVAAAGYSAYAQNQAGKAQQDLADRNAKMIDAQADDAIVRGNEEANLVRRGAKRLRGQQRAAFATQGVDVNTGTSLDLQEETTTLGEMDAATVRKNAWREAWGLKGRASNERLAGDYARRGATNSAIGTALGGIGDSRRAYYEYDAPKIGKKS